MAVETLKDIECDMLRKKLAVANEALEYISCPGKDDADFHDLDLFEAAEIAICMANRAREALSKILGKK